MQPTTPVKDIKSTAQLNRGFLKLLNRNWMRMKLLLHPHHMQSIWSVLILSSEGCIYRKGILEPEVVISGDIKGCCSETTAYCVFCPTQMRIPPLFRM